MVCLPQILFQSLGDIKTTKGNFQNVEAFAQQKMGRVQILKRFFKSDVTCGEMLNHGNMYNEAE